MIRIRPYKDTDAEKILSWSRDEKSFYQWSAGMLGSFPTTPEQLAELGKLMRFTALDEKEVVGFFTLRNPRPTLDEVRFGYVIVDPDKRGGGIGREMLRLGLVFARDVYRAKTASLGVFENNTSAYRCYLAAGFREVPQETPESYHVMSESWNCKEMEIEL